MTTQQPQTGRRAERDDAPVASPVPAGAAEAELSGATSPELSGATQPAKPAAATPELPGLARPEVPRQRGKPATSAAQPATLKPPTPAPPEAPPADAPSQAPEAVPAEAPATAPEQVPKAAPGELPAVRPKGLRDDRPPGAPPDPWASFATTTERAPGRIRRVSRAAAAALIHEYALAVYGSILLAVAMTWPTLRYPMYTLPQDTGDPALRAWQLAWSGYSLRTGEAQLWHANAFFPERFSFAFSDALIGYAPAGMLGDGVGAAILRYNIVFVLATALLLMGAYALARQLGADRTGSAVAAVAFAFAPWRLAHAGHLDVVSTGAIPLALAMLARGHGWSLRHGFRAGRRHAGWVVGGWLVAAWQLSLGFGIGLPFAYAMGVLVLVMTVSVLSCRMWRRLRRRAAGPILGRTVVTADVVGLLVFTGVGAVLAVPYLTAARLHSYARHTTAEIDSFSPPLRSLFIAPAESRVWGAAHAVPRGSLPWQPEMTLLPGFTLYALALVGLVFSVWTLRQRLFLLTGVLVATVLSLGTGFFDGRWTYLPLFAHLPTWSGIRTPGRLMLWTTLLLAVLAAGAVTDFVRRAEQLSAMRVPPWPGPWLRLAMLTPLLLVVVEGLNTTPHPTVPTAPAAMRAVPGPMLVLPTAALGDQLVLLWSTDRFPQVANGTGAFVPRRQDEMRRAAVAFPDAASVEYLRRRGITTVVLLRDAVAGTPWQEAGDLAVEALGIQREDLADAVVFRL